MRHLSQSEAARSTNFVPRHVENVIRSSGRELEPETRAGLERKFDFDFSHVRIHTDAEASASARRVNAAAYTVGQHIAFREGRYAPKSQTGMEILAHEATHVVQQSRGGLAPPVSEDSPAEAEARRVAAGIGGQRQQTAVASAHGPGLARQQAEPEESLEQMEERFFSPTNPSAKQNLARMIESLGGKSYEANKVSYDTLVREYAALKASMAAKAPAPYDGPSVGALSEKQAEAGRKARQAQDEAERRQKHPNAYDVMVSDSQIVSHAMNPSGVDPIQAATSLTLRAAGVKTKKAEAIGAVVSLGVNMAGTVAGGRAANQAAGRPLAPLGEYQSGSPVEGANTESVSPGTTEKPVPQLNSGITPPSHQLESGITPPSHQLESGITPPSRQLGSGITPPSRQLGSGITPPSRQLSSGITPTTHQLVAKNPLAVFDTIKPLGPIRGGTTIPRMFEITTFGGQRFFVNGSATEHFTEALAGYREFYGPTGRGDQNPSAVLRSTHSPESGIESLGPVERFDLGSAAGKVRPGANEMARGSTVQTFRNGEGTEPYFNRQGPAGATAFASAMVLEDFAHSLSLAVQQGIPYGTPTVVGNWELILQMPGKGRLPSVTHALPGGRLNLPGKRPLP